MLSGGKRGEEFNPDVYADGIARPRQVTTLILLDRKNHEPPVGLPLDRASLDRAFDGAQEAHAATADFRERELVAVEAKAALRVSERVEAVPPFEAREAVGAFGQAQRVPAASGGLVQLGPVPGCG